MSNDAPTGGVPAPSTASGDQTASADCTLNVFLHGLFVFLDRKDRIEILLPHLQEHTYRAGEFLGETMLRSRPFCDPYKLFGVDAGGAHFNPERVLSLRGAPQPYQRLHEKQLHCRLEFPLPLAIYSLQQVDLTRNLDNPEVFVNTVASMLHVFTYRVTDPSEIKLGDHVFADEPQLIDGKRYMSLHIFSEEDYEQFLAAHPIGGFAAAVGLFPGLYVRLINDLPSVPAVTAQEMLPGTIPAEYEDLALRTIQKLGKLGEMMRMGRFPASWDQIGHGHVIGSDITTCTNIVSQDDDGSGGTT